MLKHAKSLARTVLHRYERWRNAEHIKATTRPISKAEIKSGLLQLGLVPGDVVMLHSSLKSLGYVPNGPADVLDALYEAVSPGGTLIVPTYYQPGGSILATCQMKDFHFDPRRHGTGLGSIPSAFLKLPGIERSIHPTHSVSAIGPKAKYITETHHLAPSIFGMGSPWQRCLELNGKVLGLGINMGPVTFYHLLEDIEADKFPLHVWLRETYALPCKDWSGLDITVPVRPFDPELVRRRIDTPGRDDLRQYFWSEFERMGLLAKGQIGEAKCWSINAQPFYHHLKVLMNEGITIYSTPEDLARRPIPQEQQEVYT
jgi:aminoglycoside 3-N-acetyltransferase